MVTIDGAPLVVDTRKATALLAYLAVTGEPHRRESLAALFWPDADTARAAGALRRTLSALRSAVGGDRLSTDRGSVAVVTDGVEMDVDKVRRLLAECAAHDHPPTLACPRCVEPLAEVAALHRGRFLEGFALRDSPAFDDWQYFTAEETTRDLVSVLERLAGAFVDAGRLSDAIAVARRRLALDPLHEPAHRDLIRLYAWHEEHSAALRQYRECVRILDRELGVPPLPETTALYEEVLEQRLEPPVTRAPETPAVVMPAATPAADVAPSTMPFVGREAVRDEIVQAIAGSHDGGLLVVVEGEAGIGKTRLVSEVLAHPLLADRPAVTARCYEGETGLAYGVMVEALRAADAQDAAWAAALPTDLATEVSRLLPEVRSRRPDIDSVPSLDGPGARSRFIDGLGRSLATAVEGDRPGIVVFEDLQWVDEASLEALTHLVRRLAGRALTVVVTWRTEMVGRGSALRRLALDARRDGRLVAETLQRLDASAVTAALTAFGLDDPGLNARVNEETEGVPLLVVEYAHALASDAAALDGALPGGARDVLGGRLHGVGDMAGQVLATAAVIGRSFELDVVTEASGRTDEEVAAAIEELLAANLVAEVPDAPERATYDFTHAQLRRLAYDDAALARRRLLHRRVAAAMEGRARRRGDAGNAGNAGIIAGHWAAAGEDAVAASWEARAGAHAASLLAIPEALAHYNTALALGHPDVASVHERLGDLWTLQGRYADAVAAYESAAASAESSVIASLEHKLGVVHHRSARWDLAERHYERALALVEESEGGPALVARVTADRGLNAYRRGDADKAQALAAQAASEAEQRGDPASAAQAANLLGLLARSRGDLDAARRHLEHSLDLAGRLNDAAAETSALNNLALAVGATGDTDEALRLAGAALQRSAAVGDRHREAALHNNIADLLRARGDTEEAMTHLKQAVAIFAEVGEPGVLSPEVWKLVDW